MPGPETHNDELRRLHRQLEEYRVQLAEATELARIAYWEYDAAAGEYIFNDGFYELYGTTAAREGGYRMARAEYDRRFVHPDDLEELNRQIESAGPAPASTISSSLNTGACAGTVR